MAGPTIFDTNKVPKELTQELQDKVIQSIIEHSAIARAATRVPLKTRDTMTPVLDALPSAFFVGMDTGQIKATSAAFAQEHIVAEKIGAIAIVPNDMAEDLPFDIFTILAERIGESIGQKIDMACLFGTDAPASWDIAGGLVGKAVAAKNFIKAGTNADVGIDLSQMNLMLANQGYSVTSFLGPEGVQWRFDAERDSQGRSLYQTSLNQGVPDSLKGIPVQRAGNGCWAEPTTATSPVLLAADWRNILFGVRREMEIKVLEEATIEGQDVTSGTPVNLATMDAKAIRITTRVGFKPLNPVNIRQPDKAKRFPAAVLQAGTRFVPGATGTSS